MFLRQIFRRRSSPSLSPSPKSPANSGISRDFPFAILRLPSPTFAPT
jgi:hypothetical protein